jgi:chromosome segregation ATPase
VAHDAKEKQRVHAANLDEERAANHALQQRLATADEAVRSAQASLAAAREDVGVERAAKSELEGRLHEKGVQLEAAATESVELNRKLASATENEAGARREAAAAQTALEAAQRSKVEIEGVVSPQGREPNALPMRC